jgi:hypothetical protein
LQTATISSTLPSGTAECPAADGTTYTSHKNHTQVFKKYCDAFTPLRTWFFYYGYIQSMNDCIDACAGFNSPQNLTCLAASFGFTGDTGFFCYLFHAIGDIVTAGQFEVAELVAFEQ